MASSTVKHGYSEPVYNELMLKAKWFSFPLILFYVVNLTDVKNYAYNKAK